MKAYKSVHLQISSPEYGSPQYDGPWVAVAMARDLLHIGVEGERAAEENHLWCYSGVVTELCRERIGHMEQEILRGIVSSDVQMEQGMLRESGSSIVRVEQEMPRESASIVVRAEQEKQPAVVRAAPETLRELPCVNILETLRTVASDLSAWSPASKQELGRRQAFCRSRLSYASWTRTVCGY